MNDDTQQTQDTQQPDENSASELTVRELREQAIELGMPKDDADKFTSKAPLIATINALKAAKAVHAPESPVSPAAQVEVPQEEKQVAAKWKKKAERMYHHLMKQPKVRILVPLEGQEKVGVVEEIYNPKLGRTEFVHIRGAIQPVILNGCHWIVPKGTYVEVPQQIAQVIEDKYKQTSEAGKDIAIDRVDPETGKQVRDQL